MKLEFGYENSKQNVEVPEKNLLSILKSNPTKHERCGVDAVDYALQNPIGSKKLSDYNLSGKKIAIITSDISRPLPS